MSLRLLSFLALGLILGVGLARADAPFTIDAAAFAQGKPMPVKCGGNHDNLSPELHVANVPAKAKSLALIVDDPDAPKLCTHWLVWNLPVAGKVIPEVPTHQLPTEARVGKNTFGDVSYAGPTPPSGIHRYFFRLYALDAPLNLPTGADRQELEKAMQSHIVGIAETFGTYEEP